MRIARGIICLIAVLFFAVLADAKEKLTWDDCVQIMTMQNRDLRAAHEQLKSYEHLAKGAYSGFLPQVSANANYTRGNSYSFPQLGGIPITTGTGDKNVSSASLSISQNLFSGFKDAALVDQAAFNREESRASLDATKAQASYDLKYAFGGLLYAQKYKVLSEKIIRRRVENANIVELRYESGMENKGSLMLSRAFINEAKYDRVVARDSMDVASQLLAKVLGRYDSENIEIVGRMPLSEPGSEPDFKKLASQTPTHRQSVAKQQASESGVDVARANFYPSIDLTGTLAAQGDNSFPNKTKRSIMLNLSLPIFSGGKDYYDYKSASAQSAAASYEKESVDQDLLATLKQAYRGYVEAVEKLKVDGAFLDAAEVRAEIARVKYNNGLISFEDWDIIENDLITKQKSYLQSERDRILAEAAFELQTGRGVVR